MGKQDRAYRLLMFSLLLQLLVPREAISDMHLNKPSSEEASGMHRHWWWLSEGGTQETLGDCPSSSLDIKFNVSKGQECLEVKRLDPLEDIIPKFTWSAPIPIQSPYSRHLTAFLYVSTLARYNQLLHFQVRTLITLLSTGSSIYVAAQARKLDSVLNFSLLATSNPSSSPVDSICKQIHPHSAQWPPP